jgi:hypothetical protein
MLGLDKIGSGPVVIRRPASPASYQILGSGPIHLARGGDTHPSNAGYGKAPVTAAAVLPSPRGSPALRGRHRAKAGCRMNAVEIEEAISVLAEQPFDATEFPYLFLQAFGNKETTLKRLRKGESNKSDLGGVLQTSNVVITQHTIDRLFER